MKTSKDEKKEAIIDAAIQVFAESGYHDAKMAKVAELAGVGAGSLYLYYKDKADILMKIFEHFWKQISGKFEKLMNRSDLSQVEKLDGMVDITFDMLSRNPQLVIVFVNEYPLIHRKSYGFHKEEEGFEKPYFKNFVDVSAALIVDAQKSGLFNPNIDPKAYHHFLFGGIRWLIFQWAQTPEEFSLDSLRQDVKLFVKRGILVS